MFEDIVGKKPVITDEKKDFIKEVCPQCFSTDVYLDIETGLDIYICRRCDNRWLR